MKRKKPFTKICAWCDKKLNDVESQQVTHGICRECREKYFAKRGGVK